MEDDDNWQARGVTPGRRTLGLVGGALEGRRHLDLRNPRLAGLRSLQGCDTAEWDELLFAVKLKGGCLPCSTPPGDLDRYLTLPGAGCLAGRMLIDITLFMATPEERVGHPLPHARQARDEALQLLEAVEREVHSKLADEATDTGGLDGVFFDLFGITATQIRYLLRHTSLRDDYPPIFAYLSEGAAASGGFGEGGDGRERRPLVFDLGMSGGMDSLYYLMHGFRVVAVEANPLLALDVRTALRRYSQRLRILTAAVVSDEELSEMADPERLGGVEVDFHIHRSRPDFSALDADRVPPVMRAGTVPVRAVSCAGLVAAYGAPHGVKIDAEGADIKCLLSLRQARAVPQYLSTELPNVLKEGARPAIDLVFLLRSMGFDGFKLCRQTLYNARTVVAVSQETNRSDVMVSRQGLGLGASGPFGEAAADFAAGPRWRPAEEVAAELSEGGPVWAAFSMGDWFDLHARLR